MATGIREYGHRAARLDPLGSPPPGDPELEPATHGLRETDLERLPASAIGGPAAEGAANARVAVERLRAIYCGTTGYDYGIMAMPTSLFRLVMMVSRVAEEARIIPHSLALNFGSAELTRPP